MLRKKTEWYRTTLTTLPSIIVPQEEGVGGLRRITLLVRDSAQIQVALDKEVVPYKPVSDVDPTTDEAGSNEIDARDAYWPEPPVNKQIIFEILPDQWVVGRAADELHELSVIVEYLE